MNHSDNMPSVGWREWLELPRLHVTSIKAKIDTGARSSSLHAVDVREVVRGKKTFLRFRILPIQRDTKHIIEAEAELLEYRRVRSSTGQETLRPVIITEAELLGCRWPIELTLANRDLMGFRLLLGRQAIRGRFLVDAGRSYYGGRPKKTRKKRRHQ